MNLTWLGFCNLLRSPLNLTWLCNKASWNLLRNLLRNPVEPDLALHQNNNNNNEQRTTKNKQPTTNNQQPTTTTTTTRTRRTRTRRTRTRIRIRRRVSCKAQSISAPLGGDRTSECQASWTKIGRCPRACSPQPRIRAEPAKARIL